MVGLVETLERKLDTGDMNQREMARMLCVHESGLSKILARKRRLSDGLLARIELVFPDMRNDVEQYTRERRVAALTGQR